MINARSVAPARGDTRVAIVVALCFLILHGAVAAWVFTAEDQFQKYTIAARLFAEGRLAPERLYDFSPLYLAIHRAAQRVFPDPAPAILALQILLSAGSAAVLYLILRRHVPRPLAVAGIAVFALTPSALVYGYLFEPEACAQFLLLSLLWLAAGRTLPRQLLAGTSLALLVLTRPSFLPLALLPLLCAEAGVGWRRRLARAGAFAAPVAAACLYLWAPRSGLQGQPPAVMNPGQVFFEGNNPLANGQCVVYPPLVEQLHSSLDDEPDYAHAAYRVVARRIAGEQLSASEINRFWAAKALRYVADDPLAHLGRIATKAFLVFHDYRQHDMSQAQRLTRRLRESWLPAFPFALLSSLALAGAVAGATAWRRRLPLYLAGGLQAAVMLVFYVSERQRASLLPLFVVFACIGVARILESRRARLTLIPLVVAGTAVFSWSIALEREGGALWPTHDEELRTVRRAEALRSQGDLRGGSREAARALALNPLTVDQIRPSGLGFGPQGFAGAALATLGPQVAQSARARFDRALLLLLTGDLAGADALLLSLEREGYRPLRRSSGSSAVEYYRAHCALRRGDRDGARALLERALTRAPGDPYVLALLLALTGGSRYGEELFAYYDDIDAALLLGRASLEAGDAARAADSLTYVLDTLPEHRNTRFYLAAALGRLDRDDEAAALVVAACAGGEDPVLLEEEILGVFRRRAARDPGDVARLEEHAAMLGRYGRHEEAAAGYRRALERRPTPETAAALAQAEQAARQYR